MNDKEQNTYLTVGETFDGRRFVLYPPKIGPWILKDGLFEAKVTMPAMEIRENHEPAEQQDR